MSDHIQIGAGGLIRLCPALLPIAQGAQRYLESRYELLLTEAQVPAQGLHAGDAVETRTLRRSQRGLSGSAAAAASICSSDQTSNRLDGEWLFLAISKDTHDLFHHRGLWP